MELAGILARLKGSRKSGRGHVACCPAHDDRDPSLSISVVEDGRILVHCFAGCTPDAVCAALGVSLQDLSPEQPQTSDPAILAVYDYRDEAGRLLMQVERRRPSTNGRKQFRARQPGPRPGQWRYDAVGVRTTLYRLPELRGRVDVAVTEGERDADRLWALDVAATTNPFGAGSWNAEHAQLLAAAGVSRVVIFEDQDDAGRRRTQIVARTCRAAGLETRLVTLPGIAALGTGADVSDWLDGGHDAGELAAAIEEASPVGAAETDVPPAARRAPPTLAIVRLDQVKAEAIDWIWPQRLARGKLTLIAGDGGLGKSTCAIAMAATISVGARWPDGPAAPKGATLILSAEDGVADTIRPRADRQGADCTQLHIVTGRTDDDPVALDRDLALLEAAIAQLKPVLVVVDPLGAYLGQTDSWKDSEIRRVLAPLSALAERSRTCILGVAHVGKGSDRSAQHRVLGSVGLVNAARVVLGVGREPDSERRLLVPVKSNLCPPAPALAFTIEDGGLAWAAEPVTGVTADEVMSPRVERADEEGTEADELVRELLDSEEWPLPAHDAMRAAREHGISERTIRNAAKRAGITTKPTGGGRTRRWFWHRPHPGCGPTVSDVAPIAGNAANQFPEEKHLAEIPAIPATREQWRAS